MGTRGFITLATGNEKYYKAAANLLKSYLMFHSEKSIYNIKDSKKLPFAILADCENEYTKLFDDVIILNNPTKSYFDKISLLNNIPYDETVFIESDCLAYDDLNKYFDVFKDADEFSVIGRPVSKDAKDGWFLLKEAGKYKNSISFIPRFHSAIMYMRKGEKCAEMFNICMDVNNNYSNYMIGGSREAIDDKLLALSSAVVDCKPTKLLINYYLYYPQHLVNGWNPKPGIHKNQNKFYIKEQNRYIDKAMICHFGNYLIAKYLYKREVHSINSILNGKSPKRYVYATAICYPVYKACEYFHFILGPKIVNALSKFGFLKKIWHIIKR